jgi:ATP-binding cassette subfamily B protein
MPEGLATRIGSRGARLSGGQLLRAAAARMFVRNPQLLVIDDLSSALDVDTERTLWTRLLARPETTGIIVSHRPAILSQASQVLWLEEGRVVASGTWRELLDLNPDLQFGGDATAT